MTRLDDLITSETARPDDFKLRQKSRTGGISLRSILIGLLLVPLNVYWVIAAELRWYIILTINPLFVTPIFYLFVLVLVNAAIKRVAPKLILKPAELVIIYIMLVTSCTIATHDFIINLMSSLGWTAWMATPQNNWEAQLFPHLPRHLLVWDTSALKGYFNGSASLYNPTIIKAWLAPLAFWSVFIFALGWIMFCMTVILRKAWTEETKLSFPIVRLPLAMTKDEPDGTSLLNSPLLWAGFAVAATLSIVNGLHLWYPGLPDFQVRARWINFATSPLNATAPLCVTCYPFAIGLAFLVPLDVSFSCWFFYLFTKLQAVIGVRMGYTAGPNFPYLMEQGIGAWTAFGIALLYASRNYLRRVFVMAFSGAKGQDRDEPVSYKVAAWGLLVGVAVFVGFWLFAGMSLIWVLLVLALFLLLSICITRVRAEAGAQHTVWDLEPMNVFRLFDSHLLGPTNLAAAAMSHWYWRLNRSHVMPSQMEAFKLAQEHKISLRSLVVPMLAALALATVVGMWSCLHIFYKEGALAKCQGFAVWTNVEQFNWLDAGIKTGFMPEATRWVAVGSAAGFVVMLSWLRFRFTWWPFHPLGYCIGPGLMWLWCPFLISWGLKLAILRYGGLKLYRRAVPFFLGLVLGDYIAGSAWSLIGIVFGLPTQQIFH